VEYSSIGAVNYKLMVESVRKNAKLKLKLEAERKEEKMKFIFIVYWTFKIIFCIIFVLTKIVIDGLVCNVSI